jgi:glycosyltransferase involved in cell wall biosynthesis
MSSPERDDRDTPVASPAISIVIPTFQRADCIGRAIDSLIAQDLPDWEAVVVDDGSTDDTEAVVAGFGDRRIHYVRRAARGGVSAARNTGIEAAASDIVGFLDTDDEYLPGGVEALLEALRAEPDAIASRGVVEIPYSTTSPGAERTREEVLDHRANAELQGIAYRRDRAPDLRFDETLRRSEDRHFVLELMDRGPVAHTSHAVARLHATEGSLTSSPCYEPWRRFVELHAPEIAAHPRMHCEWELRLMRVALTEGHPHEARGHARAALRADRRDPRGWLFAGAAVLGETPLRWSVGVFRFLARWRDRLARSARRAARPSHQ